MQILLFSLISLTNSFLGYKLLIGLRKYRLKEIENLVDMGPRDLPNVSVLIPARNEQMAMRSSLEMVLASDYPKLEIIVLDDNSVDNTSDEIKRFAHAGVRFVSGEKPPEGWLGRNYAYDRLSTEASGDLLLFLSVDTKIKPKTISKMTDFMLDNQTKMLSVLPSRSDNYRFSVLFSTLRYYLELIMARVSNPPSSSGIWMIDRKTLTEDLGGLQRYRQAVMPEAEIAKDLAAKDGGLFEIEKPQYRFLLDEQKLGVDFEKRWSSQAQTEQRNFALNILKRPVIILPILIMFALHLWPFLAMTAKAFKLDFDFNFWLYLVQANISMAIYACYASIVWSKGWWLAFLLYPLIVIQESAIFLSSIYRRFFGNMIWRGREINFRKF
ncbi:MAG: glycosyltransferase [Candidatus Sacchiramonaceae bacterium]|nr:glycosyltransferase [Candidatus Saccharimonadaceae bacterium]